MYTLVVVDMQPKFKAANGTRVRENCLKQIVKAIKNNAAIIFLEFAGHEKTLEELTTSSAEGNYYVSTKITDDGSSEVKYLVEEHKLKKKFIVCGINTDYCVFSTIQGLTKYFPHSKIEVVEDACDSCWNHTAGMEKIKNLNCKNIKIKYKEEINV